MKSQDMRERFRRIANAALDTNEIIGTLVQHIRFDLAAVLPDVPLLQGAKRLGVSNSIKKSKAHR